jgi:tRNA-specific 2-thiouridylase
VDTGGRVLGRHSGVHQFTVGQRKGLGLATGTPMYVMRLEPVDARVVVAPKSDLGGSHLTASNVNWIDGAPPTGPRLVTARIRHRHRDAPATVIAAGAGRASVEFDEPQVAIAPGQAVVFYDGQVVVGGGWID